MRVLKSSRLLLSSILFSTSLAHSHPASPIERDLNSNVNHSNRRLRMRDASTVMSQLAAEPNNEGENHNKLVSPDGAFMKDLAVGDNGDEVMLYWSRGIEDADAEQAFVMIHGKLRDGDHYYQIMSDALASAVQDGVQGASSNSLVVAPQFFSTILNSGQYSDSELAWGDVNAWQAGDVATHPEGTKSSAFDALDAIIQEFSNQTHYSSLKNLTLVGHGGGGQLMQRYAVVGEDAPSPHLHIRYITGDPSSAVYFTEDRPSGTGHTKDNCPDYNTWRYGFQNFTGTLSGIRSPQEYFEEYVKRDLVALVANDDTSENGDQYCMAQIQGGVARRDRSLSYWAYVQTLAGTGFDLTDWPGVFDLLPNWSHLSGNWTNHNLVIVENVGHDAAEVFGSSLGRSALFEADKNKIQPGWRPNNFDYLLNTPIASLTSDLDDPSDKPSSSPTTPSNTTSNNVNSPSSAPRLQMSFGFLSLTSVAFSFCFLL